MEGYCGHMAINDGKITIDLGGRDLPDGIYSIVQESIARQKRSDKPKVPAYDVDKFVKDVRSRVSGREGTITMNDLAREMGIYETSLIRRLKENNLITLFKLKKPASEYMDY